MEKDSFFKRFLYTGVGLVSLTADKIEKAVDDFVSEENATMQEGKRIVDDFYKEKKEEKLEKELSDICEKMLKNFKFAKKDDLKALENRVAIIEKLIAQQK